jgi:hypothetical protein
MQIHILPATTDRLIQAVMSQRKTLQAGKCPADLRRLRMRQLQVAEVVAGDAARAEYGGRLAALPRDYRDWLRQPGDGTLAPRAA